MEQNEEFKRGLIKGDVETCEYLIDSFCDKAYSFALYYFGDRFLAEEAVRQSFAAFFADAAALLADNTPAGAYFAVLKSWCDGKYNEKRKENGGVYPYELTAFEDKAALPYEIIKILSEMNRKERALLLLADVVGLKRTVLCEIYGVDPDAMSTALSVCRDSLKEKLSAVGDFTVKGGDV